MRDNKSIEERYEDALKNVASVNTVFPHLAKAQMSALIDEQIRADNNILTFLKHETTAARRGGFIAEEFHSTTFNMNAILKGKVGRAQTGLDNDLVGNNDKVSDIVIVNGKKIIKKVQSKYMQEPGTTANKHSALQKDGLAPKYEDVDIALCPSDQANAVREIAVERAARHRSEAQHITQEGGDAQIARVHEAKAQAYENTASKASSTIENDGVSSSPLSKAESEAMGDGDLNKLRTAQSRSKTQSTLQNMGNAAAGAAAMAAIVSGTVNIVRYVNLVREGQLEASEAAIKIAAETAASAADSAIKAATNTGLQSLIVRNGSQEMVLKMASQGAGALVRSNVVSVLVVCAIDGIKDLVLFGSGKITLDQLEERSGKNLFTTSAGAVGSSIGTLAVVGSGALTVAALPIIGGMAGALIASMAMDLAIENGIEAPYRDLVSNTELLRDSSRVLDEVSRQIFQGQVNFESFLLADAAVDEAFGKQGAAGAVSAEKMRLAIDKI